MPDIAQTVPDGERGIPSTTSRRGSVGVDSSGRWSSFTTSPWMLRSWRWVRISMKALCGL
ncbi:hypothetical protein ACWF95_39340 [Streptomyces vinaceus]